ncbi:MAG: hypothetical protein ABR579_00270 [Actinomycetota bacterium]
MAKRRSRKIFGVGLMTPNPSGRFGSGRFPNHEGGSITPGGKLGVETGVGDATE